MELSGQTFRYLFSSQPDFEQQKMSASTQFNNCELFVDHKWRNAEIRVELATALKVSHLKNKVSHC